MGEGEIKAEIIKQYSQKNNGIMMSHVTDVEHVEATLIVFPDNTVDQFIKKVIHPFAPKSYSIMKSESAMHLNKPAPEWQKVTVINTIRADAGLMLVSPSHI